MPFSFAIAHSLPEVVLAAGALLLVLFGAVRGANSGRLVMEIALALLTIAFLLLFTELKGKALIWDGAFIDDAYGRFMKGLALVGAIVTLVMSRDYLLRIGLNQFEFPILVLLAVLGMLILISAESLLGLYLGLELMSLSLYVIAAFQRDDVRASEAGLKYFALGALSSGMMLYGSSLLYGFAGTVSLQGISAALHGQINLGALFGLVFLLSGLAFKMSVAPFHMWTPDVYEGAPTPVTAFFASAPKMAAIAIMLRVVMTAFPSITSQWQQIIVFVSILSMAIGSFAAIGQTNIKRLMAYSSIGHMGFALVGLASGTENGVEGVLIYAALYLIMTLGTFAVIMSMRVAGVYVERISDLAGLARTDRMLAFCMAMLMFSLAGIPPLAGFFAKWYVFNAAVQAGLYPLAVIGFLTSVVAAFYYLRIIKIIYFDEPAPAFDQAGPVLNFVVLVTTLAVLLFAFWPAPLLLAVSAAAKSLF